MDKLINELTQILRAFKQGHINEMDAIADIIAAFVRMP